MCTCTLFLRAMGADFDMLTLSIMVKGNGIQGQSARELNYGSMKFEEKAQHLEQGTAEETRTQDKAATTGGGS